MRRFKFPHSIHTFLFALALALSGHAPALAVSGPPLRTGIWVMQPIPENADKLSAFESQVRSNPHLAGVCFHIGWKEIEKEPGHLDFGAIDKAVSVLRGIGMKYELSVKPGADTPPFVYQQNFSRLIAQLGERYASDPLCVSVVLTCANFMSKEMHLPKTPADLAKWKEMGDYGTKLLEVYKKYTEEWAKAFPKQQISLHLSQVLDLPSSFFQRIIDYGLSKYPERFTIQNCQLTGRKEDTGT